MIRRGPRSPSTVQVSVRDNEPKMPVTGRVAYRLAGARATATRRARVGREAPLARLGRDLVDVVPGVSFDLIEVGRKPDTWLRRVRFAAAAEGCPERQALSAFV